MSKQKTLNSNFDLIGNKENTPTNNLHITKIEEYLNQQYNHATLVHFKNQIMKEVSRERENYKSEIKRNSPGAYEIISSLWLQIKTLQSETYFMRDERKQKYTLIKSLIALYALSIQYEDRKDKKT